MGDVKRQWYKPHAASLMLLLFVAFIFVSKNLEMREHFLLASQWPKENGEYVDLAPKR